MRTVVKKDGKRINGVMDISRREGVTTLQISGGWSISFPSEDFLMALDDSELFGFLGAFRRG